MANEIYRVENAKIVFKNFEGRQTEFNAKGNRNFSIVIEDPEVALNMYNNGWNIKVRPETKEDRDAIKRFKTLPEKVEYLVQKGVLQDAFFHMKVNVNYESRKKPMIYTVAGTKRRPILMDETNVGSIDMTYIESCDVAITGFVWENSTGSGISAYLDTMYVTVRQNPFEDKYNSYDEEE